MTDLHFWQGRIGRGWLELRWVLEGSENSVQSGKERVVKFKIQYAKTLENDPERNFFFFKIPSTKFNKFYHLSKVKKQSDDDGVFREEIWGQCADAEISKGICDGEEAKEDNSMEEVEGGENGI